MSWISELYKTYEYLSAQQKAGKEITGLLPVAVGVQNAHISVTLNVTDDGEVNFEQAYLLEKSEMLTPIPITEKSASRTTNPTPHPVFDNLMYLAGDFELYNSEELKRSPYEDYFKPYLEELRLFAKENEYANDLYQYLSKKRLLKDLIYSECIKLDGNGKIDPKITSSSTPQSKYLVRFAINKSGNHIKLWENMEFLNSYSEYYLKNLGDEYNLCYVTGQSQVIASTHSKNIRFSGDGCKLISSNDKTNYTYRGKFENSEDACMISYEVSEKAHNALKYLIRRQGYLKNEYTILSWSISNKPPSLMLDTEELFEVISEEVGDIEDIFAFMDDVHADDILKEEVDTNQEFALKLKKAIKSYSSKIDPNEQVNIIVLDSANPGRMAILYYSERSFSDYLEKIQKWHTDMSWLHRYRSSKKDDSKKNEEIKYFWGAPSAYDIVLYSFGIEQNGLMKLGDNNKFLNQQLRRLLPSIVDAAPLPVDFMKNAMKNAINPQSKSYFNWYKSLSIACSLIKKYYIDKNKNNEDIEKRYQMKIDNQIKDRSYLYGRLLAVAEKIESSALYFMKEERQTNARKYMSSFTNKPYTTWMSIHHNLQPYLSKLSAGSKKYYENEIQMITSLFEREDYKSNFRLEPEFLLAFYSQLEEYRKDKKDDAKNDLDSDVQE